MVKMLKSDNLFVIEIIKKLFKHFILFFKKGKNEDYKVSSVETLIW